MMLTDRPGIGGDLRAEREGFEYLHLCAKRMQIAHHPAILREPRGDEHAPVRLPLHHRAIKLVVDAKGGGGGKAKKEALTSGRGTI